MKLLHTADWQLGCAFRSFGAGASRLREARLTTLQRALERARDERVDAFLIAGDLFDHNQVSPALLRRVVDMLAAFPDVPTFILPGNHDPVSGPASIWMRPPFNQPPPHVKVFTEPGVHALGSAHLVVSPLTQKLSTQDPSLKLAELAAELPPNTIKIGMTHGALALEGRHAPNDHPIHPQAATRAGLDYLAVGHWHGWQVCDEGRLVMPGTPEPDSFDHADGRYGALVELSEHGAAPSVQQIGLATLHWHTVPLQLDPSSAAEDSIAQALAAYQAEAQQTVLRVRLQGDADPALRARLLDQLEQSLAPFVAADIVDETHLKLSDAQLRALAQDNPTLAGVLADLARLRTLATGETSELPDEVAPLDHTTLQQALSRQGLQLSDLDEAFFQTAFSLLSQHLQEERA